MLKKNDLVTVEITDLTTEGEGIGKAGAFPLFIKDTMPGDRVRAVVTKLKKNYGYGKALEILAPSADRIPMRCPIARRCGGCQIQEMDYQAQLQFKTRKVQNNLQRIGGLSVPVLPCVGMEEPWHYRNKAQVPFGRNKAGDLVCGFYAGRSHDIIESEDCLLTPPEFGDILRIVKQWMRDFGIEPYDERDGSGLIRHVLLRKGFHTGEILVCLVANGESVPHTADLSTALCAEIAGFKALSLNINQTRGNTILGPETRQITGPGVILDLLSGVRFRISPQSFYQVNPVQTEVLYNLALEYADLTGNETVWDLYCGIGTISLFLARKAKKVYGVEIIPQAIEDARENARLNGFTNTEFFVGKAEEVLSEWYEAHPEEQIDVITVDPPRKGCDEKCLKTIGRMQPLRVVYVSCDSATLARDLRILTEQYGYCVEKVQPVDQFSQTVEVETVCRLSKRAKKL
ncbi:MAG: 23S rRNA (uracil(1939)-C(5))-methyltransferase RlmD [Lachnospiraceae bacterium]|nr:23S rRNA (uracil(1939)-C(5))-methyltransferase RlmD [Lachnospiraceae bacterium]